MSGVFGVSGMLMLEALAAGTATPAAMADLAKRRLRRKLDRLALALDGHLAEHQRLLLRCTSGASRGSTATSPRSRRRSLPPCGRSRPSRRCW